MDSGKECPHFRLSAADRRPHCRRVFRKLSPSRITRQLQVAVYQLLSLPRRETICCRAIVPHSVKLVGDEKCTRRLSFYSVIREQEALMVMPIRLGLLNRRLAASASGCFFVDPHAVKSNDQESQEDYCA